MLWEGCSVLFFSQISRASMHARVCECECVCVYVYVRACVRVCVCVCDRVGVG